MLYNLLRSDDWKTALRILDEQLLQFDSISGISDIGNIPFDRLGQKVAAQAEAISLIRSWLNDLETRAGNFISIATAEAEEEFVKRR